MIGLDYEVIAKESDFELWTPDGCGACIGSGETQCKAILNAIENLGCLIGELSVLAANPDPALRGK